MRGATAVFTLRTFCFASVALFASSTVADFNVTTLAGGGSQTNGVGTNVGFGATVGIAAHNGTVFVADYYYGLIRTITSDGIVSTLAGQNSGAGYGANYGAGNGACLQSSFFWPWGIALDLPRENLCGRCRQQPYPHYIDDTNVHR